MKSPKDIFHLVSYAQYAFIFGAVYFLYPYIMSAAEGNLDWSSLNKMFIFMGIGISLSTLQDTSKTQNEASRKIGEDPKKGKIFLITLSIATLVLILIGLFSLFRLSSIIPEDISLGLIVLGIGLVGMLKAAGEMFENHRKDKNP